MAGCAYFFSELFAFLHKIASSTGTEFFFMVLFFSVGPVPLKVPGKRCEVFPE